jgi:two-component sensor histidine kinase/HAMP domain-containing protein
MNKLFNSLSFKIGTIIILVEMIALTALGVVYINRFSNQVDRRIDAQAQLPGVLMDAGLLNFDAVSDPATMSELVGDELITGMVVGVNGNVFYALDPDLLGMDVADIPTVDTALFDIDNLQDVIIHDPERVIAVSPIYASDQRTPRFFVYTEVSNLGATAEKTALTRLFVFGSLAALLLTSLVIILTFNRMILNPISGIVEVLKRVETGDLTSRVREPKSLDEIGSLQRSTNTMIEAREQNQAQIIHLNRVLRSIRNVNQLITQERDLDRLLETACQHLTETDSYAAAWILLLNEDGTPSKFVRRDMEGNTLSLPDLLEQEEMMACPQTVLAQAGAQIIADGSEVCQDCFLLAKRNELYEAMAIRLEFDGVIYGLLNITVLSKYVIDAEEISLFEEVAGDISFALYSMALEEQRKQVDAKVHRLLEQQVAVNQLALALGETRDINRIYDTIYQHIKTMVDAWAFIVSSYDDVIQLIQARYVVFKDANLDVTTFPPIPLAGSGQGTQSQVIHTGEALYTPDHRKAVETSRTEYIVEKNGAISEGPLEEDDEDSARSALYVPMKIGGQTVGVMQLQSAQLDAYTQDDIDLMTSMSSVAAVAVQNASLYGEVERELAERRRAEARLRSALQQTELLIRELYHRTKNNMQVIISMLMLQADFTDDPQVRKTFRETQNRIQSMALVHEKLYQSQNLSSIRLDEYIRSLADLLMTSYKIGPNRIELVFDLEEIATLIDIAMPCGLILNELLANALEHAFPGDRRGQIQIGLHRTGSNEVTLEVADDGVGVPIGFDFRQTGTFGLQAVVLIAEHQLQGKLFFEDESGVNFRLCFKDDLYRERV